MAISGNYTTPVQVNGYLCRNCTDVDYAKKHIDPQHPKSGPYNVDAASDPSRQDKAVSFGGALSGLNQAPADPSKPCSTPYAPGATVDLQV